MGIVLFDLDGTLCDITHRLHHVKEGKKNWDSFYADCVNDKPKNEIIAVFQAMQNKHICKIVSGRSDIVFDETKKWLHDNGIFFDQLIMRRHGDYTPDHELKRKWLNDGSLGNKKDILCVFDDRQRVVDMWRAEGLTCCQVAAWEER